MANETRSGLKVPAERPDKKAAARDPSGDAQDRPGFDLGGAVDDEEDQSQLAPRGPTGSGVEQDKRAKE